MNIFEHIYVSNITKEALESISAATLCVNFWTDSYNILRLFSD